MIVMIRPRVLQGCAGGDWALRVTAESLSSAQDAEPKTISILFYIGNEQVTLRVQPPYMTLKDARDSKKQNPERRVKCWYSNW